MTVRTDDFNEQSALWNGVAGNAWVASQALLDQMFKPLEERLTECVRITGPTSLLDIGCGTGATTLAAARLRRGQTACVGIDVSAPMIAAAQPRANTEGTSAEFICADAQVYAFRPARFDMIVSRFGVMFFNDPTAAFRNLRNAAVPEARMHLLAWRSAAENPFMTTAERAAAPLFPAMPPRNEGPGQFAFADEDHVRSILASGGWTAVEMEPLDVTCCFPASELETFFTRLGPLGAALHEADEKTRAAVVEEVHAAFRPYVHGEEVRFTAACWMISAWAGEGARQNSHG